jgi:hypothetical protein
MILKDFNLIFNDPIENYKDLYYIYGFRKLELYSITNHHIRLVCANSRSKKQNQSTVSTPTESDEFNVETVFS